MTIFSKIVLGEIPCYKIAEDEQFFAFLDIRPLTKGHTLVIPKQETDYLFDLNNNTLASMMLFTKRVACAIKKSIDCQRVGLTVIGLEVPHAHIHLIPIQTESDMNFKNKAVELSTEEMTSIALQIQKNFE
ncbi:MAG: HIT family protein [Paludibacter sp.]|jgi:histidine triad (HIT) family protein|nr:HIT family protein [Paludibacter sp.]